MSTNVPLYRGLTNIIFDPSLLHPVAQPDITDSQMQVDNVSMVEESKSQSMVKEASISISNSLSNAMLRFIQVVKLH
jgi:hypothetical protein